jgi:mRNA-degrading endonuclease RelE of RelBE toxin-antitoxin system
MRGYSIDLKPSAIRDLDGIRKYDPVRIADGIEKHLTFEPTRESKSRIRKLRGIQNPDYRLRIGDFRIFYAVDEESHRVSVLRVMHKKETAKYYQELER